MNCALPVLGFTPSEHDLVEGLMARFHHRGFTLGALRRVEKRQMPEYHGLVEAEEQDGTLVTFMYLSLPVPFTIAHELAHVSDMAERVEETRAHLSCAMEDHWHLGHRMTSEYYANRIATSFCQDGDIFPAFQNDRIGLVAAAKERDWQGLLINYALLLGIFHGLDRPDVEPLELLPDPLTDTLTDPVLHALRGFRREIDGFWQDYLR